jgi:hypothetical protein
MIRMNGQTTPLATVEAPIENPTFYVIHPLDDIPEEKLKSDHLEPMELNLTTRIALFALRAYLVIMLALLAYHLVSSFMHA